LATGEHVSISPWLSVTEIVIGAVPVFVTTASTAIVPPVSTVPGAFFATVTEIVGGGPLLTTTEVGVLQARLFAT
jgi:hypothetical protein